MNRRSEESARDAHREAIQRAGGLGDAEERRAELIRQALWHGLPPQEVADALGVDLARLGHMARVVAAARRAGREDVFRLHLASPAGGFDGARSLELEARTLEAAKAEADSVIEGVRRSRPLPSAEVQSVSRPWCGSRWDRTTGTWTNWEFSPDY